jgi:hypothetical protein
MLLQALSDTLAADLPALSDILLERHMIRRKPMTMNRMVMLNNTHIPILSPGERPESCPSSSCCCCQLPAEGGAAWRTTRCRRPPVVASAGIVWQRTRDSHAADSHEVHGVLPTTRSIKNIARLYLYLYLYLYHYLYLYLYLYLYFIYVLLIGLVVFFSVASRSLDHAPIDFKALELISGKMLPPKKTMTACIV